MASTYSTDLRLELIGNGDQTGTWGTTTNTNLGTLLEEAIVGQGSVAITDGVNTVITISDGASSTARKLVLTLTGTLTAARTLEVPAKKKTFIIYNNTSGGFAVTVKCNGQTGVSIPNGAKRLVYVDGTDVRDAINDLPAATTVAGSSLVTASSSTTLTNKTLTDPTINVRDNVFTLQDNADATKQLRFEVSGITTGNLRTLTVPNYDATIATLAGSETLTNKTLSGPTISGTISLTGTATFSNAITVPIGSTTTAAVNFASDPNTGFYSPGADQLRLITAGADRINIAADGSVTITGNLTVNGSFAAGGSGAGVTTDGTQTLTNKTIDTAGPNTLKVNGNTLSASAGTATITFFNSTDTVVGRNTTDTLTNKTLTSPTINGGTISGITFSTITVADNGLTIQDNADATKQLRFELSGITTGTTRTMTIPNADGTLVLTSRAVNTGTGLTGGGDLSADRTLALASIATGNVLGNFSGSSAAPGAVTPTTFLDSIGNTRGSFIFRGVSSWNALVPGTSGNVVTSNGAGSDPSYQSISAVIDNIGNTRGSVLYRGTSSWSALTPGTSGYVLASNGAGADPSYLSPSAVVDGIGNTRGSILERGASGWTALAPGSSGSVLTSSGAGADPSYQTLTSLIDSNFSSTRGTILYRGAGGWAALGTGTAGTVLTTGGAGADPSWGVTPGPKPIGSAGVGQWYAFPNTPDAAAVLPAGGTWAWMTFLVATATGIISSGTGAGINSGGTTVGSAASGFYYMGFAWRIG